MTINMSVLLLCLLLGGRFVCLHATVPAGCTGASTGA